MMVLSFGGSDPRRPKKRHRLSLVHGQSLRASLPGCP